MEPLNIILGSSGTLDKMPHLQIETNVSADKIQKGAVTELITAVSATVGKPSKFVAVSIKPDVMMGFGWAGRFLEAEKPCAQVTLTCIGKLGEQENVAHAANLTPVISKVLGIPEDRFYITFIDKPRHEVAWKGTTFAEMFKK